MNLSSKTLTFAANQISGNSVDGGVISNFASTGIDDNASSTAVTILSDGKVGIGVSSPTINLDITGGAGGIRYTASSGAATLMYSNTSAGYLGTENNYPIVIQQNNAERMRIDSSGNVGIGTSSPSSFYSLADNLVVGTGTGGNGMTIYSGSADSGYIGFNDTVSASMQGFIQYNHSGDYMAFAPNGTEKMRIASSGNVGIGTSSTNNALRVVASASQATTDGAVVLKNEMNNGFETLKLETNGGRDSILSFRSTGTNSYWWGMGIDNSDGGKFKMGADNLLGVNNRLVITQSGNVGIGTTSPIEALDVDGAIVSGNSSKPINATYDSVGDMNSFEHRFTRVKNGANSPHVLVDIQFTSNFHQAMFVIEYGARLQAVSDSTTNAVIRSFGVNRFNGGNCNITETNDTHFNSNVSSHAPIYINVVSQTRYQIVVAFSSTVQGSSFVSGSIRGYGVSSEFPTITFSDGMNGH
jgi:hypothetical protein